ncbi:MAG: MBL fold metallo-hydrolase [Sphingobium sp.]|nr:MBL fold metallo-hydrolase [Sphingobium sp.]
MKSTAFSTAIAMVCCALVSGVGADPVRSSEAKPRATADCRGENQLILLGTGGGPVLHTERAGPSSLLIVEGTPYLIDVGYGAVQRLKQAGLEPSDVGHVFLTHLHYDHTADLGALLAFNWSTGKRRPVDVIGPVGTRALVADTVRQFHTAEALYTAVFPPVETLAELTRSQGMAAAAARTLVYSDAHVRVFAVENSHYDGIPAARRDPNWKSYSLRFETKHGVIVFTGDTGPSASVTELARGADVLVSEVLALDATIDMLKQDNPRLTDANLAPLVDHMKLEHLSPAAVGQLAQSAAVREVVLNHIVPGSGGLSPDLYISKVKMYFSRKVILGKDMTTICI